jgi:putative hydrolase of the HAD superfamily
MVREEMQEFLEAGLSREYSLCLVTNQEPEGITRLLKAFGFSDLFKQVVVSDQVGFQKPDPRFFEEAIRRMNLRAEDIAFLGNNPRNDMEGAAAAGIPHRFLYDPDGEHRDTKGSVEFTRLANPMELFNHF